MILRAAALAAALAGPAAAQCELALVLALDVSSSVDAEEYRLQRNGVAWALQAPEVQQAILAAAPGYVELSVYEWSGRRQIVDILPWTQLTDAAAIAAAADQIRAAQRSFDAFPTAIGYGVAHGALRLAERASCWRRVIDVSGDGVRNDGFAPSDAYRHFPFDEVTVNGLAVLGADPAVAAYYRAEVLYGPGAFLETAPGYAGFAEAMRRKLFREINGVVVGAIEPSRDK